METSRRRLLIGAPAALAAVAIPAFFYQRVSVATVAVASEADLREAEIYRTQVQGPAYLVLGDSIALAAPFEAVGNLSPVNASFSGGTVGTYLHEDRGPRLQSRFAPELTVIALGINDAKAGDVAKFNARYAKLLSLLKGPFVLCGCADPRHAEATRRLAEQHGAAFVAPPDRLETTDGTHWTKASYPAWLAAVSRAINPT